jgi:hypothetical protein
VLDTITIRTHDAVDCAPALHVAALLPQRAPTVRACLTAHAAAAAAAAAASLPLPQVKLRDRHEALARRKLLGLKGAAGGAKAGAAGGGAVGCLLARGEGLEIVSINAYGKQLLACAADPDPAPRFVRDLLDPGFAPTHARVMAKAVRDRSLPKSIQHPLRSVAVRRADGTTVQCELLVGKLDESQARRARLCVPAWTPWRARD